MTYHINNLLKNLGCDITNLFLKCNVTSKHSLRKRAATVVSDKGEVFVHRKQCKVKVVTSANKRERILKACHSEPTSGHFGLTKTWKRIAEHFYWKGIVSDVRQLVSIMKSSLQMSCFTPV